MSLFKLVDVSFGYTGFIETLQYKMRTITQLEQTDGNHTKLKHFQLKKLNKNKNCGTY